MQRSFTPRENFKPRRSWRMQLRSLRNTPRPYISDSCKSLVEVSAENNSTIVPTGADRLVKTFLYIERGLFSCDESRSDS